MWQAVHVVLFAAVTGIGIYWFSLAAGRRRDYIRLGRPAGEGAADRGRDAAAFLKQVFGHKKLLYDWRSGAMHLALFYGFIVLQFGALDLIVKGLAGRGLPLPWYDAFGLVQEATTMLVLLAAGYAAYRRYVERLPRLKQSWQPSIVLWFIGSLMLSVLLTLAFERAWHGLDASAYAPLSSLIALGLQGLPAGAAAAGYYASWWLHLLLLLGFLVYVPQSKHFHLITAPINLWLRRTDPPGRLRKLDLEDETAESFGVGQVEDFTQKQLLDLYACVECGRCTNVCPASNTGKTLSPMHLIVKLRDHLTEKGAAVTGKSPWVPSFLHQGASAPQAHAMEGGAEEAPEWAYGSDAADIRPTLEWQGRAWAPREGYAVKEMELVGEVMSESELWSCTTCRSCEEQCPVGNEHVDKIVDMRRYLVLTQGNMPHEGQRALQNIERQGNPWGLSRHDRADWTGEVEGIAVPTVRDNPEFEWLFFVGSMGSYDARTRKVSRALARLLNEAGVSYAILGSEEKNSGDTPRRMGNEFLFQQLCADNIETFQRYGVKRIVTACPHTFNTLKNEYPDFGLEGVEVLHHTQLLERLLREGRLKPQHAVDERVAFHDSCYLGRYNGVYDAPRAVLAAVPGLELLELEQSRERAMCCGAGGGMMWMEEKTGGRVSAVRTRQALNTNPTMIGSACPYCLTMMEDGIKSAEQEERVRAGDVAEILALSVFGKGS